MNANNTQIFHKLKYSFIGQLRVRKGFCDFLSFRPSDPITTLTYVLMGKFYPCLNSRLVKVYTLLLLDTKNYPLFIKFAWILNSAVQYAQNLLHQCLKLIYGLIQDGSINIL